MGKLSLTGCHPHRTYLMRAYPFTNPSIARLHTHRVRVPFPLSPLYINSINQCPTSSRHSISEALRVSCGEMKSSGKSSKGKGKSSDVRKDRKSGTGMSGSPKKGGQGGKYTWAGDGFSPAEMGLVEKEVVDVQDPNFEDPDEVVTY